MNSLLFQLKEFITLSSLLTILLITAVLFYRFQKKKTAKIIFAVTLFLFLLASTYYLPHYLTKNLEETYPVLSDSAIKKIKGNIFIHVLGSGYTPNKNIPPNAQIGLVALGRLAEAIRVYRLLDNAIIVTSGSSHYAGVETQAEVAKNAAIVLGIPAEKIKTLDKATTTKEEANDLANQYGKNLQVIVATDAIHMPRAIRFFKAAGFINPIAAPTNFRAMETEQDYTLKWLPSSSNIALTNWVLHEYLGNIKAAL